MKIIVSILAIVALAQAETDWSLISPLHVNPLLTQGFPAVPAESSSRIVGGDEVKPNSRPFQVALLVAVRGGTAFCGGSLISPEWVLTAAHCVDSTKFAQVVLGAHNVRDETEPTQVRLNATEFIVHEKWSRFVLQNDIALVKLPEPVQLNEHIQTISLPKKSQSNLQRQTTTVSGWGKDSDSATSISSVLRSVDIKVISNKICNIFYFGILQDTHLCCSGRGGKSSCSGDSGGPLTIGQGKELRQVGIVSFGIAFGCAIGWPPAFTRVTEYVDWIAHHTGVPALD